jgi:hypothetical protein
MTALKAQAAAPDPADGTRHLELLGWAFTHQLTQEAYRRSTGEDAAPLLDRYRGWVEENLTGSA